MKTKSPKYSVSEWLPPPITTERRNEAHQGIRKFFDSMTEKCGWEFDAIKFTSKGDGQFMKITGEALIIRRGV